MITISVQTIYYLVGIMSIVCSAAYRLGYLYRQRSAHARTPRLCRYVEGAFIYSAILGSKLPQLLQYSLCLHKKSNCPSLENLTVTSL